MMLSCWLELVQGIKLELFIFDTFPLATSTALFEVCGGQELCCACDPAATPRMTLTRD